MAHGAYFALEWEETVEMRKRRIGTSMKVGGEFSGFDKSRGEWRSAFGFNAYFAYLLGRFKYMIDFLVDTFFFLLLFTCFLLLLLLFTVNDNPILEV